MQVFAPWIALYCCGIIAYAVYNLRALPGSIRNMAVEDRMFASSVALSTIGAAVIWPLALGIIVYFLIQAKNALVKVLGPYGWIVADGWDLLVKGYLLLKNLFEINLNIDFAFGKTGHARPTHRDPQLIANGFRQLRVRGTAKHGHLSPHRPGRATFRLRVLTVL